MEDGAYGRQDAWRQGCCWALVAAGQFVVLLDGSSKRLVRALEGILQIDSSGRFRPNCYIQKAFAFLSESVNEA